MAKRSLKKAIEEHRLRKGKGKAMQTKQYVFSCVRDECGINHDSLFVSSEALAEHLKSFHNVPEEDVAQINRCWDEIEDDDSGGTKVIGRTKESDIDWI